MERIADNVENQTTGEGRVLQTGTAQLERSNNNDGGNAQGSQQEPSMFQLMQTLVGVVHQQQQQ